MHRRTIPDDGTADRRVSILEGPWALKNFVNRLTKPVEEHDREKLLEFCSRLEGCHATDELQPRTMAKVVGEVQTVRIVPRAGAPSSRSA